MFGTNRLTRLETLQAEIHRQLETIVTALIVSEPRTGLAAEAFDGLRRNIAFAAQERRRQLSQLVAFTDAIDRGATIDTLRARCEQWCAEAGLQRHADPAAEPDWFQVVEGEGPVLEPIEPAWIDAPNRVLVQPGTARRVPAPAPAPVVAEPAPAEPVVAEPAPAEAVVVESAPAEAVVVESAPVEAVGVESAPAEAVGVESAPAEAVGVESAPGEPVVAEPAPAEAVVAEPAPAESAADPLEEGR